MSKASSPPSDPPDIPEQSWSNPFTPGTPLHDLYDEVVREERDLIIIIDDYYGRRGTGKTIASIQLAAGMDQTPQGITWEKVSLEAEEIRNAYASEAERSGLILDEGEVGASNRDPMTNTNKALREIMSMGRVEQKYTIVNTPIKGFIDKDIRKLADVWITMVRKGLALVHFLEWEPYSEQLLTPAKQWFEFSDVPKSTQERRVYNRLTREKRERIRGQEGKEFVPQDEHQEALQKARNEARLDMRNELLRDVYNHPEVQEAGVPQRVLGEAAGLTQRQISNIVSTEE